MNSFPSIKIKMMKNPLWVHMSKGIKKKSAQTSCLVV